MTFIPSESFAFVGAVRLSDFRIWQSLEHPQIAVALAIFDFSIENSMWSRIPSG